MAEFERIVLDKLEEIKSMFDNVPQEDIIDIRQSYKTLVYTVNTIVAEYERRFNKIDLTSGNINKNNEVSEIEISFNGENDAQIRNYIFEAIKGCFDFDCFIRTTSKNISSEISYVQKDVLTSDEAAKYLGVSKSCLYKWTMARQIPHYKSPTGKMCFFNRKEIEAWMQSNKVATDDELEQQAQYIINQKKK